MESTPYQRIELFWQSKGLKNASAFADTVPGLTAAALSAMKKRGNLPSSPMMRAIQLAYPDVSSDYILNGTGPMLKGGRALTPADQLPPPVMGINLEVGEMTDAQRADFYKLYYERTKQKLAVAEQTIADMLEAQEHAEVVQLIAQAGGQSFTAASADAADNDYTPPAMVAETVRHDVEAPAEADRVRIRRWGSY